MCTRFRFMYAVQSTDAGDIAETRGQSSKSTINTVNHSHIN